MRKSNLQKESEADAKIVRLMALDATKDGYVARRVGAMTQTSGISSCYHVVILCLPRRC
jgi:hypothetical protein